MIFRRTFRIISYSLYITCNSHRSVSYNSHEITNTMNDKHIIIVGAGAAGIAAASRLLECGINDILILEAENRIGGRVWTTDFGEGVVDMGGHWVHGEKGNVVFNMANPLNLLGESVTALFDNATIFVDSSGKFVDVETKSKVLSLMSEIEDESDEDLKTFHGSLGDYFTKEFMPCETRHYITSCCFTKAFAFHPEKKYVVEKF